MGKSQGFTLIELMVTIAVFAVIATLAVPSFGNLITRKRLDTTAKDFALFFGETRGQAISLRKNITLKLICPTQTDPVTAQTKIVCPKNTATLFYWVSPRNDIELTSDKIDVVFSGLGSAKQRTKAVNNPVCNAPTPNLCDTDPTNNPRQIPEIVPLEFTLCNASIHESRTILVSKIGTVDGIRTGTC
ncbi:prepilin-type N-terminal cleavage/methylation domain-containing protein [Acinetobacter sp. C32I]|uniref:pilus assembly FimT family protein n=1 Tax=Acinetobacter sp. C32I TaxID=2950074 RepID=UPI0020366F32|nr:prepilin-type N-terminal cleavage/methylation domain-containing protein [Acinetobacter sp. C32I]USA52357.1 prepilin-type N-terminal cleavage/methylation domain-containing protein [Acinetobacter sp. C32I]